MAPAFARELELQAQAQPASARNAAGYERANALLHNVIYKASIKAFIVE